MTGANPPRRVILLVNPTSGGGRGGRNAPIAVQRLTERGIEVVEATGTSAEASSAMARAELAEGNVDAVIACGGDGTVNLAVQLVAGTQIPLGIIPVGTGDDNARTLDIPLNDVAAAADVIAAGHVRELDLGHVEAAGGEARWFLGVMSSGFDSLVNERANRMRWPGGKARYLLAIVAELSVFRPLPYTVEIDGVHHDGVAMLVAVGNGVSYGGGMKVCPSAVPDDGELSLTFLGRVSKPTFLKVFPKVFSGTHTSHPAVTEHTGKTIRLDAPDQVAYADGERVGALPVTVEVRPAALRAFVPSA
ncbi:MAG: diacylglycerol kinase [Actinobacteria bacterium]|nr:diacylglycerol kinase [Actinomycetota bacterium]MCB9412535.1 diacylglycerol kinase [Actinomycetota bacterium]